MRLEPVLLAITLSLALPAQALPQSPTPAPGKPCCFANPGYTGVCAVTPVGPETCESILTYLNSAQAAGKSYCSATEVRGGWTAKPCVPPPSKTEKGKSPRTAP